ncbi:uncharacterized protein LOC6579062 [Drosophila mojavensis]|uniref:Uncharacterized protein n=1 Tax=Drosophila mojavensis TaxID=7230 RepID=B4KN67_DROMO|nr:uncharacterized protein LOC6579062 [Drosophila mojavensis]EDW08894.1 uncharacterized protein Dmoj_GI20209 [Drosophila mojavensis]
MGDNAGNSEQSRRKFVAIVYMMTLVALLLGLGQWLAVVFVGSLGLAFMEYDFISGIFFSLSVILAIIFIFVEKARTMIALNWILAILIMEFAILGVFALCPRSGWPELLLWYLICLLVFFLAILVGSILPHDLTLDVVILFVISFIFLIVSVFLIMLHLMSRTSHSIILYQIFVSVIILTFVMYHAQTINGGRFAELRVNDYLLASIILFYDFIVLFLLTFYVQVRFPLIKRGRQTTEAPPTTVYFTTLAAPEAAPAAPAAAPAAPAAAPAAEGFRFI